MIAFRYDEPSLLLGKEMNKRHGKGRRGKKREGRE